MIQVLNT